MSPLPQTVTAFVGAAVLGAVSAAAVYVFQHYQQEKNRHAMAQDLVRLNSELTKVRKELEKLMQKQSERSARAKRLRNPGKANSVITSTTSEFMSAGDIESSDLEFFDVSDEELNQSMSNPFDKTLKDIDNKLNEGLNLNECLEKLEDLCIEYPENPQLLWRIGKCHNKIVDTFKDDKSKKKEHIEKGLEACKAALKLDPKLADAHKWMAILVGARSDLQPIKERIQDGQLFKHHVDIAISIDPADSSLHHMVGRFCYEVAGLKWYERKVAAALYADPPQATYEEALNHFLEADKIADHEWKENKLCIARCYIALSKYKEALEWLDKASQVQKSDITDEKVNAEVETLLKKYSKYR
ncbi:regulator of microtubule dynamics protein 1-like isoform X2 [Harmonia axyridis]|uniref:regulator of microtubule dynamics protein 1-like isoform X2 n=1 Tax=Harmonia axyridis TaxID=115357 RepID=UPI001E2777F6|nr:regulator of microtubule dynamics protein 1-like isoform X2 [Harmonia axyridis]